jgi:hypothetical protein
MQKPNNLSRIYQEYWQPKPIKAPVPDPHLMSLTSVQRSAEVIRYSLLSVEFWISPFGKLREWVRLNTRLGAILLMPAILVLPLLLLITGQLAQWLALLISISGHLIVFPLVALAAAGVITLAVLLVRAVLGR